MLPGKLSMVVCFFDCLFFLEKLWRLIFDAFTELCNVYFSSVVLPGGKDLFLITLIV